MYISPDEDRSDLFLSAAVYLLGGQILLILLRRIPFPPIADLIVGIFVILATTVLVPLYLMRYRKQRLSEFGFDASLQAAGVGFVATLPLVAVYLIAGLVSGTNPVDLVPAAVAVVHGAYLSVLIQILRGVCVVLLAIYCTVKARSSFRADPAYIRPTMRYLGRFTAIGAAIAALLLFLGSLRSGDLSTGIEVLLAPVGIAGSAYLVDRWVRGSQLTSRATLLTPMVVLAVGSFVILGQATDIVFGLWRAALLAGIGLIIGVLLESRRSAWGPLGFAAGVTLLTPLLL